LSANPAFVEGFSVAFIARSSSVQFTSGAVAGSQQEALGSRFEVRQPLQQKPYGMLRSAASPESVGFGRPGSDASGLLMTSLPAGHLFQTANTEDQNEKSAEIGALRFVSPQIAMII
jgi:hypothetical protein